MNPGRVVADDVLSPFIRARHAWEASDLDAAAHILNTILSGADEGPALWVSPHLIEAFAPGPFEAFVVSLTMDDLLVPFDAALDRLWRALPGQYVLRALEARQSDTSDVKEKALDIVYRAATDGLLSNLVVDHGDVAWLVLRAPDYPNLAEILDWGKLDARLRESRVRGARTTFVTAHPELVTNLLLYGVFYRTEAVYPESVFDSLTRCGESDPELLDVASATLSEWADRLDAADIVSVGLRYAGGSPECLTMLAQALASRSPRELTNFVGACVPHRPYVPRRRR